MTPPKAPGKLARRGEFALIAELFAPLSVTSPGALGLTDDVALLDVSPGFQLVITTDTLIAGVHFRSDDPPDLIARKALRVNLSDLAAKGARPIGFLQALALNEGVDDIFLEKFAAGLAADVKAFGVPLLGGDTTSGPGPLSITITALGEVEKDHALLRRGAQPGDTVCVTGTLGDGALGLACLNGALNLAPDLADALIERYRLPLPRLMAGRSLQGLASAGMDVSDGLIGDLGHICTASGVAATLHRERLPLSPGARAAVEQDARWWDQILGGGDDYELLFTVPANRIPELAALATRLRLPLTAIGTVTQPSAPGGVTVLAEGKVINVAIHGYQHR